MIKSRYIKSTTSIHYFLTYCFRENRSKRICIVWCVFCSIFIQTTHSGLMFTVFLMAIVLTAVNIERNFKDGKNCWSLKELFANNVKKDDKMTTQNYAKVHILGYAKSTEKEGKICRITDNDENNYKSKRNCNFFPFLRIFHKYLHVWHSIISK
jgi:hypothetical protein